MAMSVVFPSRSLPYAAMALAFAKGEYLVNFVTSKDKSAKDSVLKTENETVEGSFNVAEHLWLKLHDSQFPEGYKSRWHPLSTALAKSKGDEFEDHCCALNCHLQMRTFLSGYKLSISDLVVFETLKNATQFNGLRAMYSSQLVHLMRWFSLVDSLPAVSLSVKAGLAAAKKGISTKEVLDETNTKKNVTSVDSPQQEGSFDIDLPNVRIGEVVTRFPPEASGYLHIGHAKAALINDYFKQRYQGRLVLRFDDTNPAKEKIEFEQAILDDLKSLDVKWDVLVYTSDHFESIMNFAEKLLREGKAFIDFSTKEEIKLQKTNALASPCRDHSVEENLRLWNEMKQGSAEGRRCVMRAKIDPQSQNLTLRDPALYRCKQEVHPRTGDRYKVYPTYDFACPIVDSLDGVTHTMRTTEYHDRNDQYIWIANALGIRCPHIWDYSRLNMTYTVMSKRKLQWFVNEGTVTGWDDPRFPTVRALMRHGLHMQALRQFVLAQGASKTINWMEWEKLWAFNKRIIDPIVPRYTALSTDPVPLVLTGPESDLPPPDQLQLRDVPRHRQNPSIGNKPVAYSRVILLNRGQDDAEGIAEGEEITLMDWGNAIVRHIERAPDGRVLKLTGELHLSGSVKTTSKKLTWIASRDDLIPVTAVEFGYLLTKSKLEKHEEAEFEKFINHNSRHDTKLLGDPNLKLLRKGDRLQLERRGYYIVDQAYDEGGLVLFYIPDGRQQQAPSATVATAAPAPSKK